MRNMPSLDMWHGTKRMNSVNYMLMNNSKMLDKNIKEQINHLAVDMNLVENRKNNENRGTKFCCTKGVQSFSWGVMTSLIIAYLKGSSYEKISTII
jgi:hypothetical protein